MIYPYFDIISTMPTRTLCLIAFSLLSTSESNTFVFCESKARSTFIVRADTAIHLASKAIVLSAIIALTCSRSALDISLFNKTNAKSGDIVF